MNNYKYMILALTLMCCISCDSDTKKDPIPADYKKEMTDYWKTLDNDRRNGYLQLTGLFRITDSISTLGQSANNTFQLDLEGVAPQIGVITKTDDGFTFTSTSEKVTNTNDSIVTIRPLTLDAFGSSQKLFYNRLSWQIITRSGRHYLRVWDEKNPAISAFKGFQKFQLNPLMIFEANFMYYQTPKEEQVKAQLDGQRRTTFIGQLNFNHNGTTYTLEVGNSGFVMVGDETTGDATYGGGRYIYIELPDVNGNTILDFNKLYNPPCSFSEYTTCLYPPSQNHLPFKIEAGEMIARNN